MPTYQTSAFSRQLSDKKGFTLIELLVTISILAILASIAVISYSNVQKNTRDAKRKSDISIIQSALEQYHADQGFYPVNLPAAGSALSNANGSKIYLSKIPGDNNGSSYSYTAKPGLCNNTTTKCTNYCLYATVENNLNSASVPQCESLPANDYSAIFYETQAIFTFNFPAEDQSSPYYIDASTFANMSSDVYGNFAEGSTSPVIQTNPTKWDKYSCGRTLYWHVRNSVYTSPIQSAVVCGSTPESTGQYQVQAP